MLFQPVLGLSSMEGYFSNGHVKCRFQRVKVMPGVQAIFDLTRQYHILLAKGDADNKGKPVLIYYGLFLVNSWGPRRGR